MLHEHEGELHKEEMDYITNFTITESYFYGLPKVHKSEVIRNTGTKHRMNQHFKSGWFKISSYCFRTQLRHSTIKPFYRHYT